MAKYVMRLGKTIQSSITQVGNASVVLSSGPTSTRPVSPTSGEMRYNSTTLSPEMYYNGSWVPMCIGLKPVFGTIPAQTGSANYTLSNSAPTSTSGSQILSVIYSPAFTASIIEFNAQFIVDVSHTSTLVVAIALRGTTVIGLQTVNIDQLSSALSTNPNFPSAINLRVFDQPNTKEATTYSVRVGTSSGNWAINRTISSTIGNAAVFNGNYSIKEHF
jgi:hypothetical protein